MQQQHQVQQRYQQAQINAEQDEQEFMLLQEQLAELLPEQETLAALLIEQQQHSEQLEQQVQSQQQHYEQQQRLTADSTTQTQRWQGRVDALEQTLLRSQERQQRLQNELSQFTDHDLLDEVATQQERLAELDILLQDEQAQLEQLSQQLTQAAQQSQQLQQHNHQLKTQQQQAQGQQAALQSLQQAAVGRDNQQQLPWLQQQGLANQPRLAEVLAVESGH